MGDIRFLNHSRDLLNVFVNNFTQRVEKSDPKEVSIYLLYSTASTLTRQLRSEREGGGEGGGIYGGEEGRVSSVRKVCEEVRRFSLCELAYD
jgi:hypothetical protein